MKPYLVIVGLAVQVPSPIMAESPALAAAEAAEFAKDLVPPALFKTGAVRMVDAMVTDQDGEDTYIELEETNVPVETSTH